jgi:hypothetical protein
VTGFIVYVSIDTRDGRRPRGEIRIDGRAERIPFDAEELIGLMLRDANGVEVDFGLVRNAIGLRAARVRLARSGKKENAHG